jgi:molybdopterin molybdotransferase
MKTFSIISTTSHIDSKESNILTVKQALTRIQTEIQPIEGFEQVALRNSLGRILAQPIVSPINVPAHRNAAMDGYAFNANDLPSQGSQTLQVIGTALAGQPFQGRVSAGQCVRVMTGAVLPAGTDTVVMQERVGREGEGDMIRVGVGEQAGQHVRQIGEDLAIGQTVLTPGKLLLPPELGLLASLGIAEVQVNRRLRVAFFSTGDELCAIGESLQEGQVYDSNRYTLYGMLHRLGVEVVDMGVVPDEREALQRALVEATASAEVLLTSGGVSVGEADFIKEVLAELGSIHFWQIAMRPGRPLAFGKIKETVVFGLPGNPVAVMVTFYQVVQPILYYMMGRTDVELAKSWKVRCLSKLKKRPGRREFQRGILEKTSDGDWVVRSTGDQGSGILRSMSEGNCFILLPEEGGTVEVGEWVEVQPFGEFM